MKIFKFLKSRAGEFKFVIGVAAFMFFGGEDAYSLPLTLDSISDDYSSCYFRDNGNGTSTISTVIAYKPAQGHVGNAKFQSRGVLVYSYDKNGRLNVKSAPASNVRLDGSSYTYKYSGDDYFRRLG